MTAKMTDPIGKLMGLRYKSHPWHGVDVGPDAPGILTCFIEMVPTDTVKFEVDKVSGYLKIDRPQKYSNLVPALYGFIPQTFSGDRVAKLWTDDSGAHVTGDGDPIDICVLTEKQILHGNILVQARPVGGFRMIDQNQADDKIVAVLNNDIVYGEYQDIQELSTRIINRLRPYFLTYKDLPGEKRHCEITHTFGRDEAHHLINLAMEDYQHKFAHLDSLLSV